MPLQNSDGGFGPMLGGPSTASATGLAISALLKVPNVDLNTVRRAIEFLVTTQADTGTWQGQPEMFGPRPLLYHVSTNTHAFATMGLMSVAHFVQLFEDQ